MFRIAPDVIKNELNAVGTDQLFPLGTQVTDHLGNEWVYVKAGATALDPAELATVITTPTAEDTVTVAHAIGTTTVHVTAASISAGDFKDGYLVVDEGTAIGECYQIKNNTATDDPSSGLIAVDLYQPLRTAWSTSDTDVSLYISPFNALVVNPTDAQQKPACVPQWPIAASNYGWALKDGYGALKLDVASAAGQELDEKYIQASTNHAGFGMLTTTPANADMKHIIGEVVEEADISDNKACLCRIRL